MALGGGGLGSLCMSCFAMESGWLNSLACQSFQLERRRSLRRVKVPTACSSTVPELVVFNERMTKGKLSLSLDNLSN